MGVKLWVNRNKIYLSIYQNGKLWRECTGLTISTDDVLQKDIMKIAEKLRAKKEMEIVLIENGYGDLRRGKMLLTDYIIENAKIKNTDTQVKKVIPYIIEYGNIKISAINQTWYEGFKYFLLSRENLKSSFSQSQYLSMVKQAIAKAYREKLIADNPTELVKGIKTHESKRAFLTESEIELMVNTEHSKGKYHAEIRPAFFLSIFTGLRISDIQRLKWGDVESNRIMLRQKKTKDLVYIPIKPVVLNIIGYSSDFDKDGFVFPLLNKLEHGVNRANLYLKEWAKKAGVTKNVTWHVARHTLATQLIEKGVDIYVVSKILGHTKVETTQKYARVTDTKKVKAVDSLPTYGLSN